MTSFPIRVAIFYSEVDTDGRPGWTWCPEINGEPYDDASLRSYSETWVEAWGKATTWLAQAYKQRWS